MEPLNRKQLVTLRSQAHKLKPVILIGAQGVTDPVLAEISRALDDHELIKVKINGYHRDTRREMSGLITDNLNAHLIQTIGNTLVLYRKSPDSES